MALEDLLNLTQQQKKVGLSEERITAIIPVARNYISFWREYPDIFVDFLVRGQRTEVKDGEFKLLKDNINDITFTEKSLSDNKTSYSLIHSLFVFYCI